MAKQILLYRAIYPDTAADFMSALDENRDGEIAVKVNCPGGDPYSTYGMIAIANSIPGLSYDVHGQANSCAFYLLAGSPNKAMNTCLDVSTAVAHRAASWMEKFPEYFTDAVKAELLQVNTNLREIIENGVTGGADGWKKVTGVSLDKMFSMDARLDVRLNAKQLKRLGLVAKTVPLTVKMKAEFEGLASQNGIAAFAEGTTFDHINSNTKDNVMEPKTLAELKAMYPSLYTEAYNLGATEGSAVAVEKEKNRVAAWQAWGHIDAEGVKKGIESGKDITPADSQGFQVKAVSPEFLAKLKAGNVHVVTGAAATEAKTTEQAEAEAFLAIVHRKPAAATATA